MEESKLLRSALKTLPPILKEYIRYLKVQNTALQKQIVKLEIAKQQYKDRASTFQKELKKAEAQTGFHLNIYLCSVHDGTPHDWKLLETTESRGTPDA